MKLMLSLCVALATLTASFSADAQTLRRNWGIDFGGQPGLNATDNWLYNQTTRKFNHPDVQNHLAQRINHNPNSSFNEEGVTGGGALTWRLHLSRQERAEAWSPHGSVSRVCRNFTVRFRIEYRQWDSRNRNLRTRNTSVSGTLCSSNNGRTWYQERNFDVNV